jgi:transglutaminase-like putative cysteine protease
MIDDLAGYLAPTSFVNSDALPIVELAADITRGAGDPVERACRLVYAVRDGIRYTAYQLELEPQALQATHVLETGRGWCVSKSVLLAALCRAAQIPCRLAYANVRNHMATRKLLEYMGTDVFYYHGYNEIYLAGRWVKATVAFNRSLCEKARVGPLDFDGVHDSIYHPYDLQGQRYMEYLHDYGSFADVPYEAIITTFREVYPNIRSPLASGTAAPGGDFEAEIARESTGG